MGLLPSAVAAKHSADVPHHTQPSADREICENLGVGWTGREGFQVKMVPAS